MNKKHIGCGKSHFERMRFTKTEFRGTLQASGTVPKTEEITDTELYSSYLGKIPIKAKVVGDNIYLESVYVTSKNKKIYIKILDLQENNLNDNYLYPANQLLQLTSVCINKHENLYKYIVTLYCYRNINKIEISTENVVKYQKLIDESITNEIRERIEKEYPDLVNFTAMPLSTIKKLLQHVTLYNSRVDILFAALEYLEFINTVTNGKIDTINNQDVLIFISGVPELDNAYWNGKYMVFGNGNVEFYPLTSIDVIGHELTHGLVQGVCDLEYMGHSGALNESFADIFGTMLEFYIYDKYKDRLLGKSDWLIGEDLTINDSCLRNLEDPHACQQPARMFDKYYINPTSMVDYGGVHINSGIPNHCFYLVAQDINKFDSLKIFIKCLFKLFKQSNFYDFSKILSNVSKDPTVLSALERVGLCPQIYSEYPFSRPPIDDDDNHTMISNRSFNQRHIDARDNNRHIDDRDIQHHINVKDYCHDMFPNKSFNHTQLDDKDNYSNMFPNKSFNHTHKYLFHPY